MTLSGFERTICSTALWWRNRGLGKGEDLPKATQPQWQSALAHGLTAHSSPPHMPRAPLPPTGPSAPPLCSEHLSHPHAHIIDQPPAREAWEGAGLLLLRSRLQACSLLQQVNISASELVCGRWLSRTEPRFIFDSEAIAQVHC